MKVSEDAGLGAAVTSSTVVLAPHPWPWAVCVGPTGEVVLPLGDRGQATWGLTGAWKAGGGRRGMLQPAGMNKQAPWMSGGGGWGTL